MSAVVANPIESRQQLKALVNQQLARAAQEIEAQLSEHHDGADVRRALNSRLNPSDADKELERQRLQRDAKAVLDREASEADLRLPPVREDYTLAAYLDEPRPVRTERIQGLQRTSHKALLVAGYKTGKTTLHANLTKSLTEGVPFLDRFDVSQVDGRVGIWNAEMEEDDFADYLTAAKVTQNDRVAVWNLRGYRLPLTNDAAAQAAVKWLVDNDVKYWIIDPWARVCGWSGVDESSNAEVGPLLQRIDEIASDAGVQEVLVVHHAGHIKDRPRGATVLPDWADAIWMYSRDDNDRRYLKAEGRGVDLPEGLVEIDDYGRTVYRPASRKAAKLNSAVEELVAYVTGNPGVTTSDAQESLSVGNNAAKGKVVKKAIALGEIRQEPDPLDGRRKLLFPEAKSDAGLEL